MMMQHAASTLPHFAFHHSHGLGTNAGGQPSPSAKMNHAANRVFGAGFTPPGGRLPAVFPFSQASGGGDASCPPQQPPRQLSLVVGGCSHSGTSSNTSVLDSPSLPSPQLEHLDRATRKPMMEKKRRTRMNASLKTMEDILIDNAVQQNSKMEKADILEKTIQFIYEIMRQRDDFIQRLQNVKNTMEQTARLAHDNGVNEALRNAASNILDCVNCANLGQHGEALAQQIVTRLDEVRHNCESHATVVVHQLLKNIDTAKPSTSAEAPSTVMFCDPSNRTTMLRTMTPTNVNKSKTAMPMIPINLAGSVFPPPYAEQMGGDLSFLSPLARSSLPSMTQSQFEYLLKILQQQQQIKRQQQQSEQQQLRQPLQNITDAGHQQQPSQLLSRPFSFPTSWIEVEKDGTISEEDKENELIVDVLEDESDDEEEDDYAKERSGESVDATADISERSADSGIASHDTTIVSSITTSSARRRKRKHSISGEMWRPYD